MFELNRQDYILYVNKKSLNNTKVENIKKVTRPYSVTENVINFEKLNDKSGMWET